MRDQAEEDLGVLEAADWGAVVVAVSTREGATKVTGFRAIVPAAPLAVGTTSSHSRYYFNCYNYNYNYYY